MDMELDERLVKHHLLSRDTKAKATEPLLHIRRTLDQSYFLHLKDTSQRDRDQVVYRATKTQGNLARVVMVDQLWLWILDDRMFAFMPSSFEFSASKCLTMPFRYDHYVVPEEVGPQQARPIWDTQKPSRPPGSA